MATSNRDAWVVMQSKLQAMGYVVNSIVGEPRSGLQSGLVAVIPGPGDIPEVTLTGPRETHSVILRMYQRVEEEPQEEVEFELDQFRANILSDIFGDFELGGNVAYALPTEFAWDYDTIGAQNAKWRVIDLTVAYRIDDRATFAA